MKLALTGCPPELRPDLERVFRVAARRLEIEYFAATVRAGILPARVEIVRGRNGAVAHHVTAGETLLDAIVSPTGEAFVLVYLYAPCAALAAETLAHEMVHVAQILRGDLRAASDGGVVWRERRHYSPAEIERDYATLPWETEACREGEIIEKQLKLSSRRKTT